MENSGQEGACGKIPGFNGVRGVCTGRTGLIAGGWVDNGGGSNFGGLLLLFDRWRLNFTFRGAPGVCKK